MPKSDKMEVLEESSFQRHEIERLLPRHKKIVELCLAGHSNKDIAQVVGLTPQAIGLITRAPIFQQALAQRRQEQNAQEDEELHQSLVKARTIIEEASVEAAETQVELLNCEDSSIRLQSAKAILDRAFGSQEKSEGSGQTIVMAPGSVQLLQIALQESEDGRKIGN